MPPRAPPQRELAGKEKPMKNLTVMILLGLAIAALVVAAVLIIWSQTRPSPTTEPASDMAHVQQMGD